MKISISKRIIMWATIIGIIVFLFSAGHFIYYQSTYLYRVFSEDSFPLSGISHTEHILEGISIEPSTFIGKDGDLYISAHRPSFNFDILYMDKPVLSLINYISFFFYELIPIGIAISYLFFFLNILRKTEYYQQNAKILEFVGIFLIFYPIILLLLALLNISFLPHELTINGLNSDIITNIKVVPAVKSFHQDWIIIGLFLFRFANVISNSIKLKEENELTV